MAEGTTFEIEMVTSLADPPTFSGTIDHSEFDLNDLIGSGLQDAVVGNNTSTALSKAMRGLTTLSWRSKSEDVMTSLRDEVGGVGGEVGLEKAGMVSDVRSDSVTDTPEGSRQQLVDRINTLYTDMTVFQVSWSIARRLQQDTNQLLRGQ